MKSGACDMSRVKPKGVFLQLSIIKPVVCFKLCIFTDVQSQHNGMPLEQCIQYSEGTGPLDMSDV